MAINGLKSRAGRLYGTFRTACERLLKPAAPQAPARKRFLSDQPARTAAFLQAARDYVGKLEGHARDYLYQKPAATGAAGHPAFFNEMYQVLNLLRAMAVPPAGRVLEVGSGPGWVTEILVTLGYEVDGVEPCEEMIHIARERVDGRVRHHRLKNPPRAAFHCCTLEDCTLPDDHYDAVFFHAALHHVIDEETGLAQCYRMLRPGGVLGVSEAAWVPGNRALEAALEEEMARYGTLENPFTQEYLDYLLSKHGFVDVRRYHGVNGLFPAEMGHQTLASVAQAPAAIWNTLTARKPNLTGHAGPTTADPAAATAAEIVVLEQADDAAATVSLRVKLVNRGETAWLHAPFRAGCVMLSLCQGAPGTPGFREVCWQRLPHMVRPGEEVVLQFSCDMPADYRQAPWQLDLVNEQYFWFSARGTVPARVDFAPG
jgi:SAM-dependent methyltransferase